MHYVFCISHRVKNIFAPPLFLVAVGGAKNTSVYYVVTINWRVFLHPTPTPTPKLHYY